MKSMNVLMVRIYLTEGSHQVEKIVSYLRNETKIRGITVFRAITGHGDTGTHTSSLVDLSLNLPLVIEFFDQREKIEVALEYLSTLVKPEHIVFWEAKANDN